MVKVTLKKSTIGEVKAVKETVASLGLKKIGSVHTFEDSPALRGKLKKVEHLVKVEEE